MVSSTTLNTIYGVCMDKEHGEIISALPTQAAAYPSSSHRLTSFSMVDGSSVVVVLATQTYVECTMHAAKYEMNARNMVCVMNIPSRMQVIR